MTIRISKFDRLAYISEVVSIWISIWQRMQGVMEDNHDCVSNICLFLHLGKTFKAYSHYLVFQLTLDSLQLLGF